MLNVLRFGWLRHGRLTSYIGTAPISWVDAHDVAALAAECLLHPNRDGGKVYPWATIVALHVVSAG